MIFEKFDSFNNIFITFFSPLIERPVETESGDTPTPKANGKKLPPNIKPLDIKPEKIELYKPFQTETVTLSSPVENLAQWSKEKGINYKILVKLNPWILGNKLTKNLDSFKILLPAKNVNLKPYAAYN